MSKRNKYSGLQSVAYTKRKSRGLLGKMLDAVLILLSVVGTVTLILALLAPYISPEKSTIFSIIALSVPYNYCVCLFLLLMWIVRWRRLALFMLLPVLWGSFYVGRFVQVDFSIDRESGSKGDIKILSYNTHSMGRLSSSDFTIESLLDSIKSVGADVVCLQEYFLYDSVELHSFDSILCDYPFRSYSVDSVCTKLWQKHRGFVTLSKHKILQSDYTNLSGGVHTGFLRSKVLYGKDTLEIFNTHLQTTGISALQKNRGMREMVSDSGVMDIGGKMFDRLDFNFSVRAPQADSLRWVVDSVERNAIIMGDFNSIPMSYSYNRVVGENLNDAFMESGTGYGYTYRKLLGVLRIDYILYDKKKWKSVEYESPSWDFSDHNPVLTVLKQR